MHTRKAIGSNLSEFCSIYFKEVAVTQCLRTYFYEASFTIKSVRVGGSVVGPCAPNGVVMGLTTSPAFFFLHPSNKLCARPDWQYGKVMVTYPLFLVVLVSVVAPK